MILVERSHHKVGDAFLLSNWIAVSKYMEDRGGKYVTGDAYQQRDDGPYLRRETWDCISLGITFYCREVELRSTDD